MRTAVVDIGGTFIKSGIFDESGLYGVHRTPTPKNGGQALMESVKEIFSDSSDFDAIGVSTAGQVDWESGSIRFANENIPGYTGVKIREILEEAFSVPVVVDNDVNMAALGEAYLGAGVDKDDFLCLTYGTGIGGAIVQNRQIYRGSNFSAGEFGAIVTHGSEQKRQGGFPYGTYERYASTSALIRNASEYDPSCTNDKIIFSKINETKIKGIVNDWVGEILLGLSSLIHIFNPSDIILGGEIMEQTYIIKEIRKRIGEYIMPAYTHVKIERALLGNSAGMVGAAILAEQCLS